ncbi:hypothetical protein EB809_05570 [Marinobacter sp. R17]|uniref:hypothetical protein n=1 Tax=Marinobacter sp. R17 TaxID=2484250 RepID=UPI000F4B1E59|nr:hypothetical protein [Marinobacter sp. R17]ROU00916.1 hypothetical protein EB809_05570 [Marinobacter sp. R17]
MKRLLMTAVLLTGTMGVAYAGGHHHDGYDDLPPGLQKKVDRGESLPPGWQKKLHRGDHLPDDYYRYGDVHHVDDRYDRVRIEDKVYRVIRDTREIVDILNNS